jgi:hypothetical protein
LGRGVFAIQAFQALNKGFGLFFSAANRDYAVAQPHTPTKVLQI